MKKTLEKILSIVICMLIMVPSTIPTTITAYAGTAENLTSGAISYCIKKIPYAGNIIDKIAKPHIDAALGIKPGMSIEDLSSQIKALSVKIDDNHKELLEKMYKNNMSSFNNVMDNIQNETALAYSQISKIVDYYEEDNSKTLDEREVMLEQLEVASIASSNFFNISDYIENISKAKGYISGTNFGANDNALTVIYKTYCSEAVFGGEAGMLAQKTVSGVSDCMQNAYLVADIILQANIYVAQNKAAYDNLKDDKDFDFYDPKDFKSVRAFEGIKEELLKGYKELYGVLSIDKEIAEDTEIDGGVFGDYNKMLHEVHFYYIDNCDFSSSPAKITYIPLMKEILFALASQGGYVNEKFKSKTDQHSQYQATGTKINNVIKPVVDGNISKDRLSKIYNHISNNKLFGTSNNKVSLQKALENYGFSFDEYNKYAKDNNVPSNTKKIFASRIFETKWTGNGHADSSIDLFGADMNEPAYEAEKNVEKKLNLYSYGVTYLQQISGGNNILATLSSCGYDDVAVFSFHQLYKIDNEEEFVGFIKSIANGDKKISKDFILTNDLDLKDYTYSVVWPDAKYKSEFCGSFDGNGHTIKNFSFTDSKEHRVALFRTTGQGACIKNLILENVNVSGAANKNGYAALVGYANDDLTVDNVTIKSGEISGYNYVAGLIGESNRSKKMTITNCTNNVTITSTNNDAAGIIANSGEYYLYNCVNNGAITANNGAAGGISGYLGDKDKDPNSHVEKCINTGIIIGYDCTGGICGHIQADHNDAKVIDNKNIGSVTNKGKRTAGGIVGRYCANGLFSGNINSGNVVNEATNADCAAGGILGCNEDDDIIFENNINSGNITSVQQAGGIAGLLDSKSADKKVIANSNINSGSVESINKNAGGIIGSIRTDNIKHEIKENSNTGYVIGKESTGGIIGWMAGGGLFDSNTNKSDVVSQEYNVGGIVGQIEDDRCDFKGSSVSGEITGKKSTGKICGWDGKRGKSIDNDTLFGSIFGDGNVVIIVAMASLILAAGVVFTIVYKKRKQTATEE